MAGVTPLTDRAPIYLPHLRWPVRLTRAGMVAERAVQAFWPLASVLMAAFAPLMMGWQDVLPVEVVWGWGVLVVLGLIASTWWGAGRFAWPSEGEALARVDAALPGRPIATLADRQAIGAGDAASQAVWEAHLRRMEARTREARAVEPDLRVARRDPYGLRFMAAILFTVALLFGSLWRVATVTEILDTGTEAQVAATGPTWEGWIEPPEYTGKPSLYLADQPAGDLAVPQGSRVTLRLYGEPGALSVAETVSARTGEIPPATDAQQRFDVVQAGRLAIEGEGGMAWTIRVLPDLPPTVAFTTEAEVDAMGEMALPFRATDDFGVTGGRATIALNLDRVRRSHGLSVDPDPREPLVIDLPVPFRGDRTEFDERLIDNLSEHPLANLPVTITLTVTDAAGNEGVSEPLEMVLPGRRFFQPMARAVIEQRRDFLWADANLNRTIMILRAVSWRPEDIFTNQTTYLRLSFTLRRMAEIRDRGTAITPEERAEIAQALWDLAIQLEDGTLADARERLARAQERLEEAMRNGASPEEIAELMEELRQATDDYLQMLAENPVENEDGVDEPQTGQQDNLQVTQDEIQALMDEIQRLMEEGRMDEAMALMEQLNELMENLQVTEGGGQGNGPRTPGQQSMEDLQDTLREQEELSDEAFRDLQEQFNGRQGQQPQGQQGQQGQQPQGQQGQNQPGQNQPGQGQQGQQDPGQGGPGGELTDDPQGGGEGQEQAENGQGGDEETGEDGRGGPGEEAEDGTGGGRDEGETLADRQRALRSELRRQEQNLPGLTGEAAEAAREALDRAEEAMDGAEEALREGDLGEAIENQADAMDALREGLRNLGQALAENGRDDFDTAEQTEETEGGEGRNGNQVEPARRDPLGRQLGENGTFGSDQTMTDGQSVARRTQELLDEIRRRSAELDRPPPELDYLKRLLERF